MAIQLSSNFQENSQLPLDNRIVQSDSTARDAILENQRYFGLIVTLTSDGTSWILANAAMGGVDSDLTNNANWIAFGGGGYWTQASSTLYPTTSTDRVLIGGATDDTTTLLQVLGSTRTDFISTTFTAGIGVAAPGTTFLDVHTNDASLSQIRLNSSGGTDVAAPVDGDLWYNGTELFFYDGSTNVDLLAGGGGSGDVVGPASAVNNNVVLFDGTTGKLIKDSGLALSGSNTGDQNIFSTIAVSGQSNVVSDSTSDTLTLVGSGLTITTNASTDTVTFSSA